jgi:hypothetical protein
LGGAFVPLSSDAGPEESTAALKALKEQLRVSRESPFLTATKWRDYLLGTGQAAARGRRTPRALYETIEPVELCDLTVAGPYAVDRRGEIAFYDVRIWGWDLWEVRQAAVAAIAAAEIKRVAAAELEATPVKFADSTPTGGKARTAPADAVFAGDASAEKFSQRPLREGNNNTVNDTSEELRPASDPQINAAASAPPEKEPLKPAERQGGSEAAPDLQAAAGSIVERLAEWIFAKRPQHHFNTLCNEALEDVDLVACVGGTFLKKEFFEAYRYVYETKRGHPPATDWPLREPYKSRAQPFLGSFTRVVRGGAAVSTRCRLAI